MSGRANRMDVWLGRTAIFDPRETRCLLPARPRFVADPPPTGARYRRPASASAILRPNAWWDEVDHLTRVAGALPVSRWSRDGDDSAPARSRARSPVPNRGQPSQLHRYQQGSPRMHTTTTPSDRRSSSSSTSLGWTVPPDLYRYSCYEIAALKDDGPLRAPAAAAVFVDLPLKVVRKISRTAHLAQTGLRRFLLQLRAPGRRTAAPQMHRCSSSGCRPASRLDQIRTTTATASRRVCARISDTYTAPAPPPPDEPSGTGGAGCYAAGSATARTTNRDTWSCSILRPHPNDTRRELDE